MSIDYFLYTSCLANDAQVSAVAAVIKQSRASNAITGITGVLGFDGECFAQYVEGPSEAISRLSAALQRDTRHTAFTVQTSGSVPATQRRFTTWQMGYLDVEADALNIAELSQMRGDAALQYFLEKLQALDIA